MFQALIGAVAFGETLPSRYATGVAIMVLGVALVQHGTGNNDGEAVPKHAPER